MNSSTTLDRPPITPRQHGIIDYFQSVLLLGAPTVFGLTGATAGLVRSFGAVQAVTNALSDTPVAVRRVVPFPLHGSLEKWGGLATLMLALLTNGTRRRNLAFLLGHALLATTVYNLTDYNGNPDE